MADRVQHVGLDPERVAGFASPEAQTARGYGRFSGRALSHHNAGGIRVCGIAARDPAQDEALLARRVTRVESDAVGHIFDGIAVEVDLELVHSFRVIARHRNWTGDRVADIDHEDGAGLALEHIKIGDVEADVLAGNW